MKRKKFYTEQNVDIDVEYEIEFDDLLELIESCDESEMNEIKKIINDEMLECKTIYDEMKYKVLKKAFEKYELEELLQLLNMKYSDF